MIIEKFDTSKKVMIVAELSANHNQDFDTAVDSVRAMKRCGADAVKVQTYTADSLTIECDTDYFRIGGGTLWDGRTLYDLYKEAYTPWDWQPKLKAIAEEEGLIFFSSPFDRAAVDFLEDMNVPAYKIASFEITDLSLIEYIALKRKPVLISTGIATLADIELAVAACRGAGNSDIALLKCTSSYPAPIEDANLSSIPHLRSTFGVTSGVSDHTSGWSVAVAAVALGARIVEKHFILDRRLGGPDAGFSMEPSEFELMVNAIRDAEMALGGDGYRIGAKARANKVFARSLFVVDDVEAGEPVTEGNVRSIRPGYGLHPMYFRQIIGKRFRKNLKRGTPLSWELFE